MLNKVKILNFEIWDAETGEADVVAEFYDSKTLKGFTLDKFQLNKEYNVRLTLFCKEFELQNDDLKPKINNLDSKYYTELEGKIISSDFNDEEGDIITVDAGNIFVDVYIPSEEADRKTIEENTFFKGKGRFDIELPAIS
jgi:hypothetical protein